MNRKTVFGTVLGFLLIGTILLSFFTILSVSAVDVVTIKSDGSISPSTAPITKVDNLYTLTDNISGSIIIDTISDIIIDGNGYSLAGDGSGGGIGSGLGDPYSNRFDHVVIKNLTISGFEIGVVVNGYSDLIFSCDIRNCSTGIYVNSEREISGPQGSHEIIGNRIIHNDVGIEDSLWDYSGKVINNEIVENNRGIDTKGGLLIEDNDISRNQIGIYSYEGYGGGGDFGTVIYNNITSNTQYGMYGENEYGYGSEIAGNLFKNNPVAIGCGLCIGEITVYNNNFILNSEILNFGSNELGNNWNETYPIGGNYYDDYSGPDLFSGPNQDVLGSDGIIDVSRVFDVYNIDHYPFASIIIKPVVDLTPPNIFQILITPSAPSYADTPEVTASVTDFFGVKTVLVSETINGVSTNSTMVLTGDTYSSALTKQPYEAQVQFRIYAQDINGNWAESSLYSYTVGDFVPPDIAFVDWKPTCPYPYAPSNTSRANEPVLITANISEPIDASGVAVVLLSYRANVSEWWNTTMTYNATSGLWMCMVPGQQGNSTIELFISTCDVAGNWATSSVTSFTVRPLPLGDVNGDGVTNMRDIAFLVLHFNERVLGLAILNFNQRE